MSASESPETPKLSGKPPMPEPPAWMKAIPPPEPELSQAPIKNTGSDAEPVTATRSGALGTADSADEPVETADDEFSDEAAEDFDDAERLLTFDPLFIYGIALVVTVLGLGGMPLETRLTSVWTALSLLGVLAILADEIDVPRPTVRDLAIGAGYAALVGVPLVAIGNAQLKRIAVDLFNGMSPTSVFLLLVFAMPAAETLFFRGAFQASRGFLLSALASGLWACLLLVAGLNVTAYPFVALVIGTALFALSFLYSYLAAVYNLFSAWACQIVMNMLLLWLPTLL
ncbi:MAG: hypothetical protein NZ571_01260 [Anaerolineae bacterium]|nr:hypothetical protein [Anaerolineae bacterium]